MSLINDALKKAQSLQSSAQTPPPTPPVAPPAGSPAPEATPAAPVETRPLKLTLAPPPPATPPNAAPVGVAPMIPPVRKTPLAPPPPKITLSAPPAATLPAEPSSTPGKPLTLATPPPATPDTQPPIRLSLTPLAPPPPQAQVPTEFAGPPPAGTTAPSLEELRLQYKRAGADDQLANEKAIANAALQPIELPLRLTPQAPLGSFSSLTPPPSAAATASGTPEGSGPLLEIPAMPPPPGSLSVGLAPPSLLRKPTPEAAAAFLASNPTPPPSATAAAGSEAPVDGALPGLTPKLPPPSARNAPPPAGLRKRASNPESILILVGSVLAVLLGGGLTAAYLVLRDPKKPAPTPEPHESAVAAVAETLPVDTPPATAPAQTAVPPEVAAATVQPAADSATTSSEPAVTAAPAATAPAVPVETTPPPPPPPRVNRPDPTILAWVQKIELTGIRSGVVPKVFMNGKLYEVGETVNFTLQVKLVSVTGKVLNFEDAEGNTYEYRF